MCGILFQWELVCLRNSSFSFFVAKAFGAYEAFFTCLFIGFVAGTFPSLYKQAGEHGGLLKIFVF